MASAGPLPAPARRDVHDIETALRRMQGAHNVPAEIEVLLTEEGYVQVWAFDYPCAITAEQLDEVAQLPMVGDVWVNFGVRGGLGGVCALYSHKKTHAAARSPPPLRGTADEQRAAPPKPTVAEEESARGWLATLFG